MGGGSKTRGRVGQKVPIKQRQTQRKKGETWRKQKAGYRGQDSTPRKKTDRYPSSAQLSLNSPSASRRRGRPPENPSGSDTPNTRRLKNTESQRRIRHTTKVKRVRSHAANVMWENKRKAEGGGSSTESGDRGRPSEAILW